MLLIDLGLILVASLFQGIPQVVALLVGTRIPFFTPLRCIAIATFWVFGEWLSMIGIFAFPVRTLASTQWEYSHFIQPAGLLGELFISFIIIAIATLAAQGLGNLNANKRIRYSYFALAVIIFLVDAVFGFFWQSAVREPLGSVQVIAVQPNTGMDEKNIPRFNVAMELAKNALEKHPTQSESRLVVFPESTAQYLLYSSYMRDKLSALAADYDADIIVGGLNIVTGSGGTTEEVTDIVSIGKGEGKRENGVYFIDKAGNLHDEYYTKQHRVPFFENGYLYPFKLLPGDEIMVFKSEGGNVGAIICLESILPSVVRATVADGANIVTVATNDAYLSDAIKKMHFSKSVFRALETGRAIVQASTDGVTGVALPGGGYEQIGQNTAGVYVAELNMEDATPPFMKVGNAWIPALAGLCVLIALCILIKRRRAGSCDFAQDDT
jgi:apolipoprotein N-acyltransferase